MKKLNIIDKIMIWIPFWGLLYPEIAVPNDKFKKYFRDNNVLNNSNICYQFITTFIVLKIIIS